MKSQERNFGLDLVRATAILLVVFAHYFQQTFLFGGGLLGVELFFVLSGYLIGGILFRQFQRHGATRRALVDFWQRRWFRTIPNYLFFLLLLTFQAAWLGKINWEQWILYPVFLQNFAWTIPSFFGLSWSLAVEEWFYLLFPFVLLLALRRLKTGDSRLARRELIVLVSFLLVPIGLRMLYLSWNDIGEIRKIVVCRLDSMMFGVLVAWFKINHFERWQSVSHRAWLPLAILLIVLGNYLFYQANPTGQVLSFLAISGGVALSLPSLEKWTVCSGLLGQAVTYISKVSYTTYLLHMLVFEATEKLLAGSFLLSGPFKLAERLGLIVFVLALSYLPYRFIEMPFLRRRDAGRPRPAAAA